MTAYTASTVSVAVRIKNARYDGMIGGYLHGGVNFEEADPGGLIAASFTVSQRLGFRDEMIQPYSRVIIYDKCTGDAIFEGDIAHPGRSVTQEGPLLTAQVEGGVSRLTDWSGARIFIDRDMTAWQLDNQSTVGGTVETGDSRGGTGADALTLAFPNSFHVELNYRVEVLYDRIRQAGQELGRVNYSWDSGVASGWLARLIVSTPSTVCRSQVTSTAGSGGSGAVVGGSIPVGATAAFLQFIWPNAGGSSTGVLDIVWLSILDPVVVARLHLKDGSFKTTGYVDWLLATDVWEDMLGDMLADTFDGANAVLDTGTGYNIEQLAYPDGVTPLQVADALMSLEPGCTYLVGPSSVASDKYSLHWMARSNVPRYEFTTWADSYEPGAQPIDQYNEAVARWKSPTGNPRTTVTTQSIPEMVAAGRTRRFYHDLTESVSSANNAVQANLNILAEHRFPQNGGHVTVTREVVDLWTGIRVPPSGIKPGYIARIVGNEPNRDALNNSPRNGSTLCRIVRKSYDSEADAASIDLDSEPWSMYAAIAAAHKPANPYIRKPKL
jgi:hypothetical protein